MNSIEVVPASAVLVPDHGKNMSLSDKLAELDSARSKGHLSDTEYEDAKQAVIRKFTGDSSPQAIGAPSIYPVTNEATAPKADLMDRQQRDPVVPTNVFHGKQSYARIAFPIAGHPDYDKGAYHHPVGLCCYSLDRKNPSEDVVGQCIFMPLTIACYVGTLCYQPCGIICAHQCPWLGDCPCTEQKVTAKFVREHPHSVSRTVTSLILTNRGSANQCIFDRSDDLRNGQVVPLVLLSHSGIAITKEHPAEKTFGPWRYIESSCTEGGRYDPTTVSVRLEDNEFLKLVDCDLVFDVTMWKFEVGTVVNFVGGSGGGGHRTKLHGGGRSWTINDDGTISCRNHPHLVLGV